jgi:putative NIF3 family GTP cyclohydrolase 1 type 2
LIQHDVNLLGYHLPLDAHLEYGNAARVALLLGLENLEPFGDYQGMPTGVKGIFPAPKSADQLKNELEELLDHTVIHAQGDQEEIQSMGIITGGANGDWVSAWREGLDSYLTGEISEHDWHESSEAGIHMFAGGHNATESFGIQALQKLVEKHFEVETLYIPSSNPA